MKISPLLEQIAKARVRTTKADVQKAVKVKGTSRLRFNPKVRLDTSQVTDLRKRHSWAPAPFGKSRAV